MARIALFSAALLFGAVEAGPGKGMFRQLHGGPSTVNCTWNYFEQKLDHFSNLSTTYSQRYCIYDKYWKRASAAGFKNTDDMAPIFFYTGNESPVDEYVNNTGLMWTLGADRGALLVFAEHRYEGKSVPHMDGLEQCISYCTTSQALEDYAQLIKYLKETVYQTNAPVIAFGGSYGGMLSGWMRIKYPDVLAGAIAASAPVNGLPSVLGRAGLDSSAAALSRGLGSKGGAPDLCYSNLRATWPLITEVAKANGGLSLLSRAAKRCGTLASAQELLLWGQGPWFDMAEGDFPFPSTYISFAVGPGSYPLPAWPLRVACGKGLDKDYGLKLVGDTEKVQYNLSLGDITLSVNWDTVTGNGPELTEEQIKSSGVLELVTSMTDAAGVWYNLTRSKRCYDPIEEEQPTDLHKTEDAIQSDPPCPSCPACASCPPCPLCNRQSPRQCTYAGSQVSRAFAWGPVVCNEDVNLVNTAVQGVGRDIFWPPNQKQGYTLESVVGPNRTTDNLQCTVPFEGEGLFGVPTRRDSWANWLTSYYRSADVASFSNIVWSNGALDPWSGAGVYPPGGSALGPMVQNLTADGSSVSLVIDLGAHHLDLFFPTPNDPPSAVQVRAIEADLITRWSQEHYNSH